jgi:subtilisin family serine protease
LLAESCGSGYGGAVIRMRAPLAGALVGMSLLAPAAWGAERDAGEPVDPPAPRFAADRVIVHWEDDATRSDRLAARADAEAGFERTLGAPEFQLLELEAGQTVSGALAELNADPAVAVATRDGYDSPHAIPDDPLYGQLWGLSNPGIAPGVQNFPNPLAGADIGVLSAWNQTVGTPSTVMAILDSGYRFAHPDLAAVAWDNTADPPGGGDDDLNGIADDSHGADFVGSSADSPATDGDPTDDNMLDGGHGVHVAGTAGAAGDDGVGITGVAQNARIMPLRVCSYSNVAAATRCPTSSQIAAINYAGSHGARVANMSLGGTVSNQAVVDAFAANPQTLFVVSAGNDTEDNDVTPRYPCNYRPDVDSTGPVDNIICVAATNQADQLASFSDWGATSVDQGAPGTETQSAYPVRNRDTETFSVNDFATKWTATGASGGFARTNEAPLASFGMADTPGAGPTASTTRESTSAAFTLPAGLGSCQFSQRRQLSVGAGNEYRYAVLLNGTPVFQSAAVTSSGVISTVPIPELDAGGNVQIRERYAVGASPGPTNGVWLDDLQLNCYESVDDTTGRTYLQGTSMAAPHVTGAAALLFSLEPATTVAEARNLLLSNVDPVAALAGKTVTGGRLDIGAVLDGFDEDAPAAPQLTATTPASPANDNAPLVKGSAEAASEVALYANASCTGPPAVTGTAATLAATGIPLAVANDADTQITATATDTADNTSSCSTPLTYVEDSSAPDTSIVSGPGGPTTDTTPTFGFDSPDGIAFQCSIDTGTPAFGSCSGPGKTHTRAAALVPGPYTFRVRALDSAGNADTSPATRVFSVSSPPVTLLPPPPGGDDPLTPALSCTVPKLKGKSLAKAKAALAAAHCKLGKVTKPKKRKGRKLPKLVVRSSKPAAGTVLAAESKVAVKLAPKPKPKRKR